MVLVIVLYTVMLLDLKGTGDGRGILAKPIFGYGIKMAEVLENLL